MDGWMVNTLDMTQMKMLAANIAKREFLPKPDFVIGGSSYQIDPCYGGAQ